SSAQAGPASNLLLTAMDGPRFAKVDKDERTVFYRSLGKLGAPAGLDFLAGLLAKPPKKLFKRRKGLEAQLLAVQGLVEDGSLRSLRALEDALLPSRKHAPAVVAACRAAGQDLRSGARGKTP
ncbi:MAG TPA: hypothetical protein VF993_12715, partial [Myxococcales bacterium]